jgi:DNA polymerase III sliding clamp (beta) subunit (PCNA family)
MVLEQKKLPAGNHPMSNLVIDKGNFDFGTFMAEEFPKWPEEDVTKLLAPTPDLIAAMDRVMFAAGHDDERVNLMCVHIVGDKSRLTVEATNGKVFAQVRKDVKCSVFDLMIPLQFVKAFCAQMSEPGAACSFNEKVVVVRNKPGSYIFKLYEAKYPSTDVFISAKRQPKGDITPEKWKSMFEAVVEMSGHDSMNVPQVVITSERFKHTGKHGSINLPVPEKLKDVELNVNANNFPACLKALNGEKAKLSIAEGHGAIIMEQSGLTIVTGQLRA